jgi:hypothetical protein
VLRQLLHPDTAPAVDPQVARHTATQPRQGRPKGEHRVELAPVAVSAPTSVVEVLLAAGRIDSGGLEMPMGVRTDPHIPPGWRDHQLRDPLEHPRIVDSSPVGVEVLKATAAPSPRDARLNRGIAAPPADSDTDTANSSPSPQYPASNDHQTKPSSSRPVHVGGNG